MPCNLELFLRAEYPANRKVTDSQIQIDDRQSIDHAHEFCTISVVPIDDDQFRLLLRRMPESQTTKELIEIKGGEITDGPYGSTATVVLSVKDTKFIRELASAIKALVGRGARYDSTLHRNWKWICPRTAKTLELFARHLRGFRSAQAAAKQAKLGHKSPR